MHIAVDIAPISKKSTSAHKVRGVGMYINFLVENLEKYDKENEYVFFEDGKIPTDCDLVHYPYFDPFFRTLPFNIKKKFVVTVHDLTPLVFPKHFPTGIKGKINWQIQKKLLKKATAVAADSNCSAKDVKEIVGIGDVRTVYLAADEGFKKLSTINHKPLTSKKFSLPENFLLYVGDATWNKNLPRLIEAVRQTKYKLVMVGKVWETSANKVSPSPWNDDLRKVLSRIEGDEQFIKLGFVDDAEIVKVYNLATALIMPSIYEGFGLPVLEALNCGTPVISSRGGSLPEIGGNAVWYTDDLDVENIRGSIEKVMGDLPLRSELSQKGLEQAKNFNAEKSVADIVKVYKTADGKLI
jgi:glycosyltransferase involved in cell wall biosynthesis